MRVAVLGGSSPFTAGLVDAIVAAREAIPPGELWFHGRNKRYLDSVQQYAHYHLSPIGWQVMSSQTMDEVLEGANFVIHQIRYGGMEGRAKCERFAARLGLGGDESIGPVALYFALTTLRDLQRVCASIRRNSPDAWIINLTNPLSITTTILTRFASKRCLGICELPSVTAKEVARVLEIPIEGLEWSYLGLNHRGFIYELNFQGRSRIQELCERLGQARIGGITAQEIAQLEAIPSKYFRSFLEHTPAILGRAAYLTNLRERIFKQLRQSNRTSPPSLSERYPIWYAEAVVPTIAALTSKKGRLLVIDFLREDLLVWEQKARVAADCIQIIPSSQPGRAVTEWIRAFRDHERAVLEALFEPNLQNITLAVGLDPMVPASRAGRIAQALWEKSW